MRARESLADRNAARYADTSPAAVFATAHRSERRVRLEQISILRDMGFSRAVADAYADADLPLDAILDTMCNDDVEFDAAPPRGGFLPRLFRALRVFR